MHGERRILYHFGSIFLGQEGDSCEVKALMQNLKRFVLGRDVSNLVKFYTLMM